jgi:hypothetical protein
MGNVENMSNSRNTREHIKTAICQLSIVFWLEEVLCWVRVELFRIVARRRQRSTVSPHLADPRIQEQHQEASC